MERAQKKEVSAPVGRWGEREKGILEVATSLYAREGYENVSMAMVASAAGLSEGTLYNYFRDKRDLVLRVSAAAFEGRPDEAARIVAEATSLREGLEGLIALELRLLIEAREIFRIWLREVRGASSYRRSPARKLLRDFSSSIIHLFEKWNAIPEPRLGLNLALARDIVFGSLEHIVWTAVVQRREDRIDVDQLSRDLAAAYLRAFGLAEAEARPSAQREAASRPTTRSRPNAKATPTRSKRQREKV